MTEADLAEFTPFPEKFMELQGWSLRMLDPQLDLAPSPLEKVLVIASIARSGSSLLCEDLRLTGGAGVPKEYLNPRTIRSDGSLSELRLHPPRRRTSARIALRFSATTRGHASSPIRLYSARQVTSYLRRCVSLRTTPNGVFSLKVQPEHWQRQPTGTSPLGAALRDIPSSWVFLRRSDRLRQAISWAKADQTAQWVSAQPAAAMRTPSYDEQLITRMLDRIKEEEEHWEEYFQAHRIETLRITYEDYCQDRVAGIMTISAFAGLGVTPSRLSDMPRQADDLNEEWRARYLSSHPTANGVTRRNEPF
jgi:LPS sulfotransferase NodH